MAVSLKPIKSLLLLQQSFAAARHFPAAKPLKRSLSGNISPAFEKAGQKHGASRRRPLP
jgi:hypothetical protein